MNNDISIIFNMTKEELKKAILSFDLKDDEKKVFDKVVKAFDELYDLTSTESKEKIFRSITIYMLYKQKGGK